MKRLFFSSFVIISCWMVSGLSAQTGGNGSIRTVVIDPGHGGKDPGAVYGSAKEKDIVLDIALKLGNHIRTAYPGVKVIYTRDKDVFVPLFQRSEEHTSELQSRPHLVCRLLLEKKKKKY